MANVGIIEQYYHSHIAYYVAAAADAAGHDVTLFTTEVVRDRIDSGFGIPDGVTVDLRGDEPLKEYLQTIDENDLDLCSINTVNGGVEDYPIWANSLPDCPTVVWTYAMNRWFGRQPDAVTVKDAHVEVSSNNQWAFEAAHRQAILRQVDGAIAEYQPWLHYVKELDPPVSVYYFPPTLHEPFDQPESDGPLDVIVPGAIRERRDYEVVAQAFNELFRSYGDAVQLSILGRCPAGEPYGASVIGWADGMAEQGWQVRHWGEQDFIPRQEYDAAIREADAILAPIVETEELRGFEERLGTTLNTGVVYDAIRHATPLLLPEHFEVGDELAGVLSYSDGVEGLVRVVRRLLDEDGLHPSLAQEAWENSQQFVLERQAERFDTVFEHVTSSR